MKKATICFVLLVGVLCLSWDSPEAESPTSNSSGWGNDILIYEGRLTCFDVDYTMDGTIYLAFQEDRPPYYPIHIYTSSDHGYTWREREMFFSMVRLGRLQKMRILVGEPIYKYIFLFYVSPVDGRPYVRRSRSDFSGIPRHFRISDHLADPARFGVARSVTNRYSMEFVFVHAYGGEAFEVSSWDYGETWDELRNVDFISGGIDLSIAWGPPFEGESFSPNYYIAYCYGFQEFGYTCVLGFSYHFYLFGITSSDSARLYDPHVAASNDANSPALWVVMTEGWDTASILQVATCPSLEPCGNGDWSMSTPFGAWLIANYHVGDIKFYKERGNPYVNVVWTKEYGTHREVHFTWSSGEDPFTWHDDTVINDHDAHLWSYGAAPKIVYSPGAPCCGGGVVYAGFGRQNLYFDAPWNRR